ncbi:hypothetical protein CN230_26940 [Sinorhizobium meliloti]|uniref:hypothetical protein n=1 Tax=Rhizobium meliloti TaxID=382 RepID=UPI000FD7E261|nr:hypothetical protein [Sinorhizobium meliloti]RVG05303.1 hypothetical protein CN230_26940 [Sinorhizobium meliloti]
MKSTMFMGILAVSMIVGSARADSYHEAIDGLMRASYRHMELTYVCREITGLSRYRNAFVAAQNAIRATGMPTDIAMSTAVKMVSNIEAAPAAPDPGFSDCTIGVTRTKQELLDWGAKFRRSQR